MTVDVARGQGKDYSAFSIIDATEMPYKVAATYRNNEIAPMLFPTVIDSIGKQYNTAYILTEINDIGGQVVDILHNELEYENILMVNVRGRKGQVLSGGCGGKGETQLGIRTTTVTKRVGCSTLKSLIERDQLIIDDLNTINELISFVAKKQSYEADDGHNDDLVMTLVLFSWLTTQGYFKELMNIDTRTRLFEDKMKQIEEDMLPFGFIQDGNSEETFVDGEGTVWNKVDF